MPAALEREPVAPPSLSKDDQWDAIVRRDPRADGVFCYAVLTTGVYCRPSCASRPARRENVRFHPTCADAEEAGFRPCKRCRPNPAPRVELRAAAVADAPADRAGAMATASAMLAGMALATMLATQTGIAWAGDAARNGDGSRQAQAAPTRTVKERLGSKASDQQRVNDCKVPLDLRGPQPRPDDCSHGAPPPPKR